MTASKFKWLLIAAIAAAFFPIFLGQFPAVGDMRDVYIPLETFFHNETLAGRLPSWNPDIAWGYPVIASAQIGYFYPPLLILRLLPLWLYFPIILLGHFVLLGIGSYKFIRKLEVSEAGAYLGALSFTLGSFIINHTTHLNIIITAAWLPWQMLVAHLVAQKQSVKTRDYALSALVLGLPFLAGQLQIPLMIAALSSIYFIYLRWQNSRQLLMPSLSILVLALVVILIAAAQLLPTTELMLNSSRGPAGDFDIERANQYSYPLYHLPTLLFPRFFDADDKYWGKRLEIEHGFFIGTIPIILAIYFLATSRAGSSGQMSKILGRPERSRGVGTEGAKEFSGISSRETAPQSRFFFWLMIITFLLALGSLSPFRLIGLEPSLWVFTAPSRWLLFTTFGLAIFSALGFDQLSHASQPLQKKLFILLPIILAVVLAFNAVLLIDQERLANFALARVTAISPDSLSGRPLDYYQGKMFSLINSTRQSSLSLQSPFTYLTIISLGGLAFGLRRQAFHWLLIIATAELVIIAATTVPTTAWSAILAAPGSINQLPASVTSGQARLYSIRRSDGDTGAFLTNPATRADTRQRQQYQQLLIPLIHSKFGLPGIEWPASLSLAGHTQQLAQLRGEAGYAVIDQAHAESLNIGAVLTPDEGSNSASVLALSPAPRANADYQQITPTQISLTPATSDQTTVNVINSYYPGWRASSEGQPLPVTRYNDIFQQIDVPAGSTSIQLTYQPRSIHIGVAVSALALLTCGILIFKPTKT